jgi:hypothetical protein
MLVITTLETKQLTPGYISLAWVIESTTETLSNYRLHIWKSTVNSPNLSDYELLVSGINPQTTAYYNDTNVMGMTSKNIDYFYKIQISGLVYPYGSTFTSDYYINVVHDKYAREIERRRNLVFTKHSGQPFFLLKRRAYGTFCPTCYDSTLQRTTQSKCLTCYDTGFTGGYFGPIDVIGQLMERPVREIHQMFGAWQDQDSALYCEALPPINPKDILVDRLSRRWIALNVGSYSKGTHSIGQIVQLRQIEKEDIAHEFPVTY